MQHPYGQLQISTYLKGSNAKAHCSCLETNDYEASRTLSCGPCATAVAADAKQLINPYARPAGKEIVTDAMLGNHLC